MILPKIYIHIESNMKPDESFIQYPAQIYSLTIFTASA